MERQEAFIRIADARLSRAATTSFLALPAVGRDTIARVKRSLASLAGIVGIAALGRLLTKRRAARKPEKRPTSAEEVAVETVADPASDPAEELRRKLAAQRPPEVATEPAIASETLEERRARVHAKAREAMGAMSDDEPAA